MEVSGSQGVDPLLQIPVRAVVVQEVENEGGRREYVEVELKSSPQHFIGGKVIDLQVLVLARLLDADADLLVLLGSGERQLIVEGVFAGVVVPQEVKSGDCFGRWGRSSRCFPHCFWLVLNYQAGKSIDEDIGRNNSDAACNHQLRPSNDASAATVSESQTAEKH